MEVDLAESRRESIASRLRDAEAGLEAALAEAEVERARRREAFEAATRLQGVTDASAKKLVEDAKRQAKRL